MSITLQEFVPSTNPAVAQNIAQAAGDGQFTSLNFSRRAFTEFTDGEYRVLLADGRNVLLKARSALEAMEMGLKQGAVQKVERANLNRMQLLGSEVVANREAPTSPILIKPGATLVSFDTMCKVLYGNEPPAAVPAPMEAAVEAPIVEEAIEPAPFEAETVAVASVADVEVMESGIVIAGHNFNVEQLAEAGVAMPLNRALSEEEIDRLLKSRIG